MRKVVLIAESPPISGIAEFEARQFGASAQTLASFLEAHDSHEKVDEGAFNLGSWRTWNSLNGTRLLSALIRSPLPHPFGIGHFINPGLEQTVGGQHAESIPFYKELLDKHPRSQLVNNAALELAEVEFENGGPQGRTAAVERLEKLLDRKIDPQLRQLTLYRLGIVQFDLKAYGDSPRRLRNCSKTRRRTLRSPRHGDWASPTERRARAANGDTKPKACARRWPITKRQPKPAPGGNDTELQRQALLRIGETYASLENWDASQKSYEKFVHGNPNHKLIRTAHLGYGWSLHNQEKYDEAVASYTKTVKDAAS